MSLCLTWPSPCRTPMINPGEVVMALVGVWWWQWWDSPGQEAKTERKWVPNYNNSSSQLWCWAHGSVVKTLPVNAGDAGLIPGSGRSPEGRNGNLLQYSCWRKKSHGQRSLVGYSPWGCKESDTAEQPSTYSHIDVKYTCLDLFWHSFF